MRRVVCDAITTRLTRFLIELAGTNSSFPATLPRPIRIQPTKLPKLGASPTHPLPKIRGRRIVLTFCLGLCSSISFAALGGDASSVQSDVAHLQGALRITQTASYSIHEVQTPTGTTVREYLSPAGKVFAVAWQGPWLPDLQQLLGSYFTPYQQAAQAAKRRPGRAPVSIHQSSLVVEQSGHMRGFVGRAYLTDQIPSGVTEESIR
jgi:hypothetical protein